MGYDPGRNRLRRHEAVGMEELLNQFIRDMKLASGLNRRRAAEAWEKVSGAGRYTLDVYLDKGVMTCTVSSSVVRNQLYFQREHLVRRLNECLAADDLFVRDGKDEVIVKTLILR